MLLNTVFAQEASGAAIPLALPVGGLLVLLAVVLLLWCVLRPNVGRVFARMFAVLAIGGGAGILTWGIVAAALGETLRWPANFPALISEPSEAIGWGAGCLAAGVTALVLSFVGTCAKP